MFRVCALLAACLIAIPTAADVTRVRDVGEANTVVVEVEDHSGGGGVWKPVLPVAE